MQGRGDCEQRQGGCEEKDQRPYSPRGQKRSMMMMHSRVNMTLRVEICILYPKHHRR